MIAIVIFLFLPLLAIAAPQGLSVVSGNARFEGHEIHVGEPSVLHWDSYSLASHEYVHYPSPHATLNRVVGSEISEIHGHLSSNGPLWLINQNGIIIGEGGRIHAASFLASTLDKVDELFVGTRGRIEQHGVIECPGGYVMLMAAEGVEQTGTIRAERVGIGAGREIVFMPKESLFEVSSNFAKAVIQCKGLIEASRLEERGGEVLLLADRVVVEAQFKAPDGFVEVSGNEVEYRGVADLRGEGGTYGTLLIDPVTVTISAAATANATIGNPTTFTADTATINNTDLQTALGLANVLIDARNAAGAGTGAITWSASAGITWAANTTLSLTGTTVTLGSAITSTSTAANTFVVNGTGAIAVNAALAITGSAGNDAINITTTGAVSGTYTGIAITAAVSSADGNITMNGRGGTTGACDGIAVSNASGSISIADGRTLTLTGTGGGNSSSMDCRGIHFSAGTLVIGSGATGATAIFTGVGGGGTGGSNMGVRFASTFTAVTVNGASVLRFRDCVGGGIGVGNSSINYGVFLNESIVSSTAGAEITFGDITGGGGGTGTSNIGLVMQNATISAPVIQMETGANIIRSGTASGSGNIGIAISTGSVLGSNSDTTVLSLKGMSMGTGASNQGIALEGGAVSIADGGTLTLHGTAGGGSASGSCHGINFSGGSLTLGNSDLNVNPTTAIFTGIGGGGTGGSNSGVSMTSGITGITFHGTARWRFRDCVGGGAVGGGNSNTNRGIYVNEPVTTSVAGTEISFANITGGGSGTGNNNNGLFIDNVAFSAPVIRMETEYSAVGIRSGIGSGTNNHGVLVSGASAALGNSAATTTLTLTASSLGTGGTNTGIRLSSGSINIADGGTLTFNGTGGNGSVVSACHGVDLAGGTVNIGTVTGATAILTGAGGTGSGGNKVGVYFQSTLTNLVMNGASALRLRDCMGGGTAASSTGNYGVRFDRAVTTSATNAEITFANITGGGAAGGGDGVNSGLFISNVEVSAPTIRMETEYSAVGIRGGNNAGSNNYGIWVNGASGALGSNSFASTISLTASNLATGSGNPGIQVQSGGKIQSAGTGTITLNGTGANGTGGANYGIQVTDANSAIRTATGAISLTGTPGNAGTLDGVRFVTSATVQSTGAGEITLVATSGSIGLGNCTLSSGAALNCNSPVVLRENTPNVSAVTTATFANTINGTFAMNATADTIVLQNAVGGITALGALALTGTTAIQVSNNITTSNANLTFTGPVSLTGSSIMSTGAGAGNISFSSTINGAQNLTLSAGTGTVTLSDAVGGTTPLGTVACSGSQINVANNITTNNANLTFTGPVSLTGPSTMNTGAGAGNISFSTTVNGAQNLILGAGTGTITLSGSVGGTTPLVAMQCTGSQINVANNITASSILMHSPVSLTGNSVMTAPTIHFQNTVNGDRNLTLDASSITVDGTIGGVTPIDTFNATANGLDLNADINASLIDIDAPITVSGDFILNATGL